MNDQAPHEQSAANTPDSKTVTLQEVLTTLFNEVTTLRPFIEKLFIQNSTLNEHLDYLYRLLKLERGWLPPTRGFAASPDMLVMLAEHILTHKPQHIVELGSGVSTLVIARCLQMNGSGHLISIDQDDKHMAITQKRLADRQLEPYVTPHLCPLVEQTIAGQDCKWYDVRALSVPSSVDLILVDGPYGDHPLNRWPAGPVFMSKLSKNAVVFADDARREREKQWVQLWLQQFPHLESQFEPTEHGLIILRPRA